MDHQTSPQAQRDAGADVCGQKEPRPGQGPQVPSHDRRLAPCSVEKAQYSPAAPLPLIYVMFVKFLPNKQLRTFLSAWKCFLICLLKLVVCRLLHWMHCQIMKVKSAIMFEDLLKLLTHISVYEVMVYLVFNKGNAFVFALLGSWCVCV